MSIVVLKKGKTEEKSVRLDSLVKGKGFRLAETSIEDAKENQKFFVVAGDKKDEKIPVIELNFENPNGVFTKPLDADRPVIEHEFKITVFEN